MGRTREPGRGPLARHRSAGHDGGPTSAIAPTGTRAAGRSIACVLFGTWLLVCDGSGLSHAEEGPVEPPGSSARAEVAVSPQDGSPRVDVVRPRTDDIEQRIQLAGSFEPFEHAELHAKVTGYLEEVRVDIGSRVQRGELLARVAMPEMEAELLRARAEIPAARARLDRARAQAELASVTADRLEGLQALEPGAVMEQDVDVARAERRVATSRVAVARADHERAKARLDEFEALARYAEIRAPFAGVVTRRHLHPGALVVSGVESETRPVVSLARTDRLRLVLPVPERLSTACSVGLELAFQLDPYPDRTFSTRVARLAGALDPESRNMRVEADVPNAEGQFLPGMYARVELDLGRLPNATEVPAAALRGGTRAPFVLTVDGGRLRRVPVRVLKDDGDRVVVSGDLDETRRVVVAGASDLVPGIRVRLHDRSDARPNPGEEGGP